MATEQIDKRTKEYKDGVAARKAGISNANCPADCENRQYWMQGWLDQDAKMKG